MPSCAVKSCQNYTGKKGSKEIKFFRFPVDPIISDQWKVICKNENINVKNARICSIHFDASAFKETSWIQSALGKGYMPTKTRKLKADAIPTEYLEFVNQVPDKIATAQLICIEEQSNVEHRIVEQDNDSLYAQSFDTDAKEKTLKQNKNVQRMCQRLLARNKYLERELFKQRKRVKVNSDIRLRKILSSVFTPGQIKLLLNPNKKKTHWSADDIVAAISLRTVKAGL